ncbi:MAG: hypothetical protein DWQ06_07505 [Calditrichaeota bacterium]|nr:MAG: hypothetical protein DWQ06_07505 [Calditrichota bacterium]
MKTFSLFFLLLLFCFEVFAHQGFGILVDESENIFFTDISRQTIWKIDKNKNLIPLAKEFWSHQICFDKSQNLYFTNEEVVKGKNGHSLWKLSKSGNLKQVIPPTSRDKFISDIFLVSENEELVLATNSKLFFAPNLENLESLSILKEGFESIRSIFNFGDKIYVVDGDKIKILSNEKVVTLAENLVEKDVSNISMNFIPNPKTINRLFGLAVDESENVFVAYFGNSQILKIDSKGEKSVFYQSKDSWSPVGIAISENGLVVKESKFVEKVGWLGPKIIKVSWDKKVEEILKLKD